MARRLVLLSLLLSVLLLLSWLTLTLRGTGGVLLAQKEEDLRLVLDRSADYLELYAEGLNTSLRNLASALSLLGGDEPRILSTLSSFQRENSDKIQLAACVLDDGRALCSAQPMYEVFGSEQLHTCYEEASASRYRGIRWTEPYTSSLTLLPTFALYIPVEMPAGRAVAAIEVRLSTMLADLLHSSGAQEITWAVVSEAGALVAASGDYVSPGIGEAAALTRAVLGQEIASMAEQGFAATQRRIRGTDYLTLARLPICMRWTLLAFVKKQAVRDAIRPIEATNLVVGILHLLLLGLSFTLLGRYYTRPLARLADKLRRAPSPLALSFQAEMRRTDEVGILSTALQSLVDDVGALMREQATMLERQRRLEIDSLQAQIHPHFLGNTLACIASLAKENRSQEVQSALLSLVRLLNYSIARTDAVASLQDELRCVEAYVRLRQMRSQNAFDYEACVDPAHGAHPVPRLLVQPVVENAIVHGFSDIPYRGKLCVASRVEAGHLLLIVDDNGSGAPQRRLDQVLAGRVEPAAHAHGIGLKNVFERIRLTYAQADGCRIEAKRGGGVRVTLDLGRFDG